MPAVEVVFFRDDDGGVPAYEALQQLLKDGKRKAFAKCYARIARLAEMGWELRRPEADYLRDEIYELRATFRRVNYRILYFFHGSGTAVLSHLIRKEAKVPEGEIDRAVHNKEEFEADPSGHTFHG